MYKAVVASRIGISKPLSKKSCNVMDNKSQENCHFEGMLDVEDQSIVQSFCDDNSFDNTCDIFGVELDVNKVLDFSDYSLSMGTA